MKVHLVGLVAATDGHSTEGQAKCIKEGEFTTEYTEDRQAPWEH